jgi:hypothetical protein
LEWNFKFSHVAYKSPISWIKTFTTILTWHALRTHVLEQIGWNATRRNRLATLGCVPIPWWTYGSIQFVDQIVSSTAEVLEIGGGNSTVFWSNRGNQVLTLETNAQWVVKILDHVSHKTHIKQIQHASPSCVEDAIGDRKFDVAVNDGPGDRTLIVDLLLESLKPGGILIWDNSERSEYAKKISEIRNRGWKELSFHGLGPINAYASSTSVFFFDEIKIS